MKITFLGTGTSQGVPVIACNCTVCASVDHRDKRLRSSVLVQTQGQNIVIDTGPDFRQQMLRARPDSLDAILYTHEHKDHTAGLDDIRPFYFRRKADVPVYARANVIHQLKQEYHYMFAEKRYPGVPAVEVHEIFSEAFQVGPTTVQPIEVMHHKLPVLGFRIGGFTYITDANYISPEEQEKIKGSQVLVLNALQTEKHISHFTLQEAIDLIVTLSPQKAYLTHISHRLGTQLQVEKLLPPNIALAYDGLTIEVD